LPTNSPPAFLDVRSQNIELFEAPMKSSLFGVVRLDRFPFRILLNSKLTSPRQEVALVHEMLHIFVKLYKIEPLAGEGYPHLETHNLSCFVHEVLLPALRKGILTFARTQELLAEWLNGHGIMLMKGQLYDLTRFVRCNIFPVFQKYMRLKKEIAHGSDSEHRGGSCPAGAR